jgi:hypothetical protein
LPPCPGFAQQLATVSCWFIWQGAVFRVSASTLHQLKTNGGLGLFHVVPKCRTLLLYRMWISNRKAGRITAAWMQYWCLRDTAEHPPHWNRIPGELQYVRIYATNMAYISSPGRRKTSSAFNKRMHDVLCTMDIVAKGAQSVRVIRRYSLTRWKQFWHNLHKAPFFGPAEVSVGLSDSLTHPDK